MEVVHTRSSSPGLNLWFKAAGRVSLLLFIGLSVLVSLYAIHQPEGDKPTMLLMGDNMTYPENRTPTDREINRLCRQWAKTTPDDMDKTLSWQSGWEGPLGAIAAQAGLTFDWRCHVAGHVDSTGLLCRTRPSGPVRFRLHPQQAAKAKRDGSLPIQQGEVLVLRGIRHALSEKEGVVIEVKEGCKVDVILSDERQFIRTRPHRKEVHAAR